MSYQSLSISGRASRRSIRCVSVLVFCAATLTAPKATAEEVPHYSIDDDDLFLFQSSITVRSVAITERGESEEEPTITTTTTSRINFPKSGIEQPNPPAPAPGVDIFDYRFDQFPPSNPTPDGCDVSMINPSFLLMPDGEVLSAFRLTRRETWTAGTNGALDWVQGRPRVKTKFLDWQSTVYVGRAPANQSVRKDNDQWGWQDFGDTGDFRMSGEVAECNNPVSDAYREGPEDPRLFSFRGKVYMTVVGDHVVPKKPLPLNESDIAASCGHLKNATKERCESRPLCPDMMGQRSLYMAEVLSWTTAPWTFGPSLKLVMPGMAESEKNWSPFLWKGPDGAEELRMIYGVYPHTVLQVDVATGRAEILHTVADTKLSSLAAHSRVAPESFHGGSGVARVENGWAGTYNLAFFHSSEIDDGECKFCYRNWPYMFSTEPPYNIIDVGLEISPTLFYETEAEACYYGQIQFISSVLLDGGDLVIGYNTGDSHSRVFRMPLWEFERRFFGAAVFSMHHGTFARNATTTEPEEVAQREEQPAQEDKEEQDDGDDMSIGKEGGHRVRIEIDR